MRIKSLGSSSSGNAYILDDGSSLLLIECGFSYKPLTKMIREQGYALSQIAGVLISHEHTDHAKCWDNLVNYGLPVYASRGTIDSLTGQDPVLAAQLRPMAIEVGADASHPVTIGSYDVIAFRTFHDAAEPIGFLIRSRTDKTKLVFATDTVQLRYQFKGIDKYMLEANYSDELLSHNQHLPDAVVKRIRNSHMEIDSLCAYLNSLDLSKTKVLCLLHLSDTSSDEYKFYHKVRKCIPDSCQVVIFPKGGPKKEGK